MKTKTGIDGLDEMLYGGLVDGDVTLLAGSAGTGKTTIALEFLVNGALKYNENGLIITFEELPEKLNRDAANFGWDLDSLEKEGKIHVLCTSPEVFIDAIKQEDNFIDRVIREKNIKRLYIDSISNIKFFIQDPTILRQEIYAVTNYFKRRRITAMLLSEVPGVIGGPVEFSDMGADYVVDCVIFLRFIEIDSAIHKGLVILKMRGSNHDKEIREFQISNEGVKVKLNFADRGAVLSGNPSSVKDLKKVFENFNKYSPIMHK